MIPRLPINATLQEPYSTFVRELQEGEFHGEIRTDYASRLVVSTDNSVYQIVPQAVVFPRTREDVVALARLVGENRFRAVRLMPRGGGTGTNGGSLGTGICVDLSKFMNRILDFDPTTGVVRVEPGVVLDQLNAFLQPHGVFFAPHVAPSDRATLGGMISNDSCGQGSRLYGRTSRHVESLDLVLCDGSSWRTARLPRHEGCDGELPGRIAAVRAAVAEIACEHADLIAERFPAHDRFLTGYDLAHASRDGGVDLSALVCGSEGTLAFVVEAALRVTPIPPHRTLLVALYASFDDALAAAGELLDSEPSAIETVDHTILDLARQDVVWNDVGQRFDDATGAVRAMSLIELCDSDPVRLQERSTALVNRTRTAMRVLEVGGESEAKAFWALRNRGVGLLGNMAGPRRPVPFVEDCAVPPSRLAAFVNDFRALLDGYGLAYGMYGHVDVGCLHVRPALDLQRQSDLRRLREISDRVFQLVRKYGGVFWGEHGKGLRSEYNPEVFGPVLYEQIRRIKHAFDPYNQMNPGKVATPSSGEEELAKIEAPTRGERDRDIAAEAQAQFETALACNGNGACFSWDSDYAMCPSMKATADRIHSPKGRATLLREWLRQLASHGVRSLPPPAPHSWAETLGSSLWRRRDTAGEDFSSEVFEALAGCLSCKACVAQCPVHVDIPEFKSRFLDAYHRRYRRPLSDYLVAAMESVLPHLPQSAFRRLTRLGANAVRAVGLIDPPMVAPRTAEQILAARGAEVVDWKWRRSGGERVVALIPDVFTNYLDPQPLVAMYELVRASGVRTVVLPYRASGKPQHIKGFLAQFERLAAPLARDLSSMIGSGVELVCVEPAIALYFRQECSRFAKDLAGPRAVALPQEWLAGEPPSIDCASSDARYALLGHCTESTTAALSHRLWEDVFTASNARVELVAVGCCGMAGAFGHETAHLDESRQIFDTSWRRRVEGADPHSILATGYSCREQVTRFAGFRPRHPLEVLRDAMGRST